MLRHGPDTLELMGSTPRDLYEVCSVWLVHRGFFQPPVLSTCTCSDMDDDGAGGFEERGPAPLSCIVVLCIARPHGTDLGGPLSIKLL